MLPSHLVQSSAFTVDMRQEIVKNRYKRLTETGVIDRLINCHHHYLALKMCECECIDAPLDKVRVTCRSYYYGLTMLPTVHIIVN